MKYATLGEPDAPPFDPRQRALRASDFLRRQLRRRGSQRRRRPLQPRRRGGLHLQIPRERNRGRRARFLAPLRRRHLRHPARRGTPRHLLPRNRLLAAPLQGRLRPRPQQHLGSEGLGIRLRQVAQRRLLASRHRHHPGPWEELPSDHPQGLAAGEEDGHHRLLRPQLPREGSGARKKRVPS